jgi:lysophospholipase L1-like esterase
MNRIRLNLGDAPIDFRRLNDMPHGGRMAALGDSFISQMSGTTGGTELNINPSGGAVWAAVLSDGQLTFTAANNFGLTGDTTAGMLSRLPTVLAAKANWDVCLVDGARNDLSTTQAQGDATIANLQAICILIMGAGGLPCLGLPNAPRTFAPDTASDRSIRGYVNRTMRLWCRQNRIPYYDYFRDCADPTSSGGGAWATGYSDDTLHPNKMAGRNIGLRIISALQNFCTVRNVTTCAWDVYDATLNPKGNIIGVGGSTLPALSGTQTSGTGMSGTGLSGFLPTSTNMSLYSGTATCVMSKIVAPATAGYGSSESDKAQGVISSVSSTAGWEFFGGFTIPAGLAGVQCVFEADIECTARSGNASDITYGLYCRGSTGGSNGEFLNGVFPVTEKQRPVSGICTIGTATNFLQWAIGIFVVAGATCTLQISNPVIRPI